METPQRVMRRVDVASVNLDKQGTPPSPCRLASLTESLLRFGQLAPLLVQAGTRSVIDGRARLHAMIEIGWESCDVVELAVDDLDALREEIERTSAYGVDSDRMMDVVLEELGYATSADDLDELFRELAPEEKLDSLLRSSPVEEERESYEEDPARRL